MKAKTIVGVVSAVTLMGCDNTGTRARITAQKYREAMERDLANEISIGRIRQLPQVQLAGIECSGLRLSEVINFVNSQLRASMPEEMHAGITAELNGFSEDSLRRSVKTDLPPATFEQRVSDVSKMVFDASRSERVGALKSVSYSYGHVPRDYERHE